MLAGFALALVIGCASASNHWSYPESTSNGWDGTCQSGSIQSPIALNTTLTANIHAPLQYRQYFNSKWNKCYRGRLVNDGNTVSWYVNPSTNIHVRGGEKWHTKTPNIRDGPFGGNVYSHAYYLWRIDFHWGEKGDANKGSEHTIDGLVFPLEMQMIHYENQMINSIGKINFNKAHKSAHGVAILSILFHVDEDKPQVNQQLTKVDTSVLKYFGKRAEEFTESDVEALDENDIDEVDHDMNMRNLQYGFEQLGLSGDSSVDKRATTEVRLPLNIGAFIRKATNKGASNKVAKYWTYQGSLTYPDCDEAVTWVVYERSLPIAQVQANTFSSLYQNNYREPRAPTSDHQVQYLLHGKSSIN